MELDLFSGGRRKFAKILYFASILFALSVFFLKFLGIGNLSGRPSILTILFGVFIFSTPNLIFFLIANKSSIYRFIAVFISSVMFILNAILFLLSLMLHEAGFFLFLINICEIFIGLVFASFIFLKAMGKKEIIETLQK
jgi:hypothetical protein